MIYIYIYGGAPFRKDGGYPCAWGRTLGPPKIENELNWRDKSHGLTTSTFFCFVGLFGFGVVGVGLWAVWGLRGLENTPW